MAAMTLFAALAVPAAASAAPSKVVTALVTAAQREFDAGNFARAGELFLAIWRQDPTLIAAIYNAARSFQLAGNLDKADEIYRELLAVPNLDAGARQKAEAQREALRQRFGERKAEAAVAAERDGKLAMAAGLWADALELVPERADWQLRRARALHLAGDHVRAREAYERWLAAAKADDADRAKVQGWLAEVAPTPKVAAEAAHPTSSTIPDVRAAHTRWPAWTLVAGGGAAALGGGVLLGLAASEESSLNADLARTDASGKIVGLDHSEATTRAAAIETRYLQGWIAAGVGAVALGAGVVWLRSGDGASVALLPVGRGALVRVAF